MLKTIIGKIKIIFTITLTVFSIVSLVTVLIQRIKGEQPQILGFTTFRISSGSMYPTYDVGDVILCKHYKNGDSLNVGDVIVFESHEPESYGLMITHRIVDEKVLEDGERLLVTKGDANSLEDSPVSLLHVYAKVICKVGLLSILYSVFISKAGLMVFVLPLILMMVSELLEIKELLKEGKEQGNDESGGKAKK